MREELTHQLRVKYPQVLGELHCLDIGDGWYGIIDALCHTIQEHLDCVPESHQVVATKVNEEYGGLRFASSGGDDHTDSLTTMAEAFSYHVCEKCGCPGEPSSDGWVKTLCEAHHAQRAAGELDSMEEPGFEAEAYALEQMRLILSGQD